MKFLHYTISFVLFIAFMSQGCSPSGEGQGKDTTITVTATAYNSLEGQTANHPAVSAWGDTLKPGMHVIAVSRDLIDLGLTHNTKVNIDGFSETFYVKDKMNKRWTKKIDIYMGEDSEGAKNWGKQEVDITFKLPVKEEEKENKAL